MRTIIDTDNECFNYKKAVRPNKIDNILNNTYSK